MLCIIEQVLNLTQYINQNNSFSFFQTSFGNAVKSKARLSIKGEPERQTTAVGSPDLSASLPDLSASVSMSTVVCSY